MGVSVRPQRLFFALVALAALAAPAADPLDAVFAQIDAASKTFQGMTADIVNTQHTAIVNDDNTQAGAIKLLRDKNGHTRIWVDLKDPGAQTISLDGKEARIYNPRTKIVQVRDMAKYRDLLDQFLPLGFGAASAELKAKYDVTWVGEEKIGVRRTAHLKLIPKSADTRRTLKQADLWFGDDGLVAQQKFLWAAGDYKLVTYSNMQLRPITDKELELNPKGATIQKVEQ